MKMKLSSGGDVARQRPATPDWAAEHSLVTRCLLKGLHFGTSTQFGTRLLVHGRELPLGHTRCGH